MKQLCLAMLQLAADMEDKFDVKKFIELEPEANKPAKYAKWPALKQSLMPYTKSEPIFHCPGDPNDERVISYSFNENLDGIALGEIADPSKTVLLYEGKDGKLDFRHDGRATIGFADGHVKLVGEEAAQNLQWKP